MTISTYTELVSAIKRWGARTSLPDAAYDDCIALTETAINKRLRVAQMSTWTEITLDAGETYVDQPSGMLGSRAICLGTRETGLTELEYRTPSLLVREYQNTTYSGTPEVFTLEGATIRVAPTPSAEQTLSVLYYTPISAITALNPTNWLLTAYSDVYLFGGLTMLSRYVRDDEGAPFWENAFNAELFTLDQADTGDRWSGGSMHMRAES